MPQSNDRRMTSSSTRLLPSLPLPTRVLHQRERNERPAATRDQQADWAVPLSWFEHGQETPLDVTSPDERHHFRLGCRGGSQGLVVVVRELQGFLRDRGEVEAERARIEIPRDIPFDIVLDD